MIRLLLFLTLTASCANATELNDISGTWTIDDQFGTYEIKDERLYLTYTMYDRLYRANYGLGFDNGNLLLHDKLGKTLEFIRQIEP